MSIYTELNKVTTAGQTRAAIGESLNALGRTYPLLSKLRDDRARTGKGELDTCRLNLEGWYRDVKLVSDGATYLETFRAKRHLIERAYVVIAGVEGEAGHVPQISNWQILGTSILEAPKVFAGATTKALKEVGAAAGSVVGGTVGGVLGGLGISGTLTIVVVGAIVLLVVYPGLFGKLIGRVGGGGA